MKKIVAVIGILVGLSTLIGGLYAYDRVKADQEDLIAIEYRLDQKIVTDKRFYVQKELWEIEKQYGYDKSKYPTHIIDRYNKLKYQLKEVEEELDRIQKGKRR